MASAQSSNPRKRPLARTSDSNPRKRARPEAPPFRNPKPTNPNEPSPTPINPLKRRIRSLTRLLSSPASANLPATKRQEHEREFASLKAELEEAEDVAERKEEERRRSKVIGKYHKVRFFERRKAERRLKQLRKRFGRDEHQSEHMDGGVGGEGHGLGGEGEETGDGGRSNGVHMELSTRDKRQMLHEKEVDVQYTHSYPLDEPYLSLFAAEADREADSEANSEANSDKEVAKGDQDAKGTGDAERSGGTETTKKPKIWYLVEEAMSKGQQALQDLREGRWADRYRDEEATKVQVLTKKPKSVKQRSKQKPPLRAIHDSELDGQAAYEARQRKSRHSNKPAEGTMRAAGGATADGSISMPHPPEADAAAIAGNRRERRKLEREQAAKRKEHDAAKRKAERRAAGEKEDDDEDETGVGFFE